MLFFDAGNAAEAILLIMTIMCIQDAKRNSDDLQREMTSTWFSS